MNLADYPYLLNLYSKVTDYIDSGGNDADDEEFAEIIVFFCTVVERILKIELHNRNPILVLKAERIKDNSAICAVANSIEHSIETINIFDVIERYKIIYPKAYSENDFISLKNIFQERNGLIHSYCSDNKFLSNKKNILIMMSAVWIILSKQLTDLFGEKNIKKGHPTKKYTEKELENVLIEEVTKKIQPINNNPGYLLQYTTPDILSFGMVNETGDECPRCGSNGFVKNNQIPEFYVGSFYLQSSSDLYKCRRCNLELTDKEYAFAKKIRNA